MEPRGSIEPSLTTTDVNALMFLKALTFNDFRGVIEYKLFHKIMKDL